MSGRSFGLKLSGLVITATVVAQLFGVGSAAAFDPNNLMDDSVFDDYTTMTVAEIDAFLNSFSGTCIGTRNGFSAPNPTGYAPNTGFTYGGNVSAGTVIYSAAQAYRINPQVILATLQKEQSLVTGGSLCSNSHRFEAAMGYDCPDSGACPAHPASSGFTQQVIRGTWLLKFGQMRSRGNVNWAEVHGSWNNSDDPDTYYGGPMVQGTLSRSKYQPATYFDGYTTIDGASVRMGSGATAALYWYTPHFNGNKHFVEIFQAWFGSIVGSDLVRTVNNATVYLVSDGYRYPIADTNVLNDFSPLGNVRFVSDTYLNDNTVGPTLGHMVGDNNGTLFFVNSGIKLAFTSCPAVADYGYSCGSVIKLTDLQLMKLYSGPNMTQVYATTSGKKFYISAGAKREVFDQTSLTSQGLPTSANMLLEGGLSYLPYGSPVIRNNVVTRNRANGQNYYYETNKYYPVEGAMANSASFAGFTKSSLDDPSIPPGQRQSQFTGMVTADGTNKYIVLPSGKVKLTAPAEWVGTYTTVTSSFLSGLPDSNELPNSRLVKSANNGTVYYVTGTKKRPIPGWNDLLSLKPDPLAITVLPDSIIDQIPTDINAWGVGSLVKSPDNATVYAVKSLTELMPISSFVYPNEFGLSGGVRVIPSNDIAQYSKTVALTNKLQCNSTYYIGTEGKAYGMTSGLLAEYGFSAGAFQDGGALCDVLNVSSQPFDQYIRVSNGTIFFVDDGQKKGFTSFTRYTSNGGNSGNTVKVSDFFAASVPDSGLIN